MSYWGRVIGTLCGFMFGRIPGAVLGYIVGHFFDKGYSQDFSQMGGFSRFFSSQDQLRSQAIFFHSLFSVMGHVAKADGKVTDAEIAMASSLMDQMGLEGDTRREAQQAFREGKAHDFPVNETLREFHSSCHGRRDISQVFLEILIQAAYVDGRLDKQEQAVLEQVAKTLGFKQHELLYLMSMFEAETRFRQAGAGRRQHSRQRQAGPAPSGPSIADAYRILGVKESDDDRTVKRSYRRLMSEHHPDKLVSKGLPKQALEIAKTKAQDIQAAYEMVKQKRGVK